MDRAELEGRLIAYAANVAAAKPVEVWLRNGVEFTPDMGPGPRELVHRPLPLKDYEREAIREILDGNPFRIKALRDSLRAVVVYGLVEWGAEEELLQGVITLVWEHDYREMLKLFPRRSSWSGETTLRKAFESARFPIDHLPERVTIYRGIAVGEHEKPPCSGIAWTLRRDLACWFAVHFPGPGGSAMFPIPASCKPHLLVATVRRERVAAHLHGRNEDEIIIFGMSVRTVSVMSDEHDIREGEAREAEARRIASEAE